MKILRNSLVVGCLLSFAVLPACGTADEGGLVEVEEGAGAGDELASSALGLSSSGCGSGVGPGTYDTTIVSSGVTRSYRIVVPPAYRSTTPSRVVLSLHGFGGTALQQSSGGLVAEGAANNYITVFPQGVGNAWNSGPACCSTANDVQFMRDVVADVGAHVCIDGNRVFVTGFSNGAMMAQRLACEATDLFAGVVSVAGSLMLQAADCRPTRRISVLEIHGTADDAVCWNGTCSWDTRFYMSVPNNIQFWRSKNTLPSYPTTFYSNGAASCQRWRSRKYRGVVELCTIAGGKHCTPGTGGCNNDLNANMAISTFSAAHSLNE